MDIRWQYRTILFEFQKDGLLGDKYIDDEEVEKTLNEQGSRGWELISVTMIQEGLLAFCKRPVTGQEQGVLSDEGEQEVASGLSVRQIQEEEKQYIRDLARKGEGGEPGKESDQVGGIRISR